MQARNPIFDDITRLASGAMGATQAAREEIRAMAIARAERLITDMDLAGRDEVETLKTLLGVLSEKHAALDARLTALEKNINQSSKP